MVPEHGLALRADEELAAYRTMLLIRRFEEKVGQLCALGAVEGSCALSIGHEAAIVGALMAARPAERVIAPERCHGHMLALGIEPQTILAELLSRAHGICAETGASGPRFAGAHRLVGAVREPAVAAALGAGVAFAAVERGSDAVCLCFLGDADAAGPAVHDTYALAAAWRLPIVYLVDRYRAPAGGLSSPAAPEHGGRVAMASARADGMDVRTARAAVAEAIGRARSGAGPVLLEMTTVAYQGHRAVGRARTGARLERREEIDPLARMRLRLVSEAVAAEAQLKAMEKEVRDLIAAAAETARSGAPPGAVASSASG
jgi:pyruvate dehydrogenase E1 component alpha subunit